MAKGTAPFYFISDLLFRSRAHLRFFFSPLFSSSSSVQCVFINRHPMKPHRVKMTHNLLLNYGLYRHMDIYVRSLFFFL